MATVDLEIFLLTCRIELAQPIAKTVNADVVWYLYGSAMMV